MEKAIKDDIYWMRKETNLSKIRDILLLIEKYNGLRYTEIADIGVKEGIFIKKDGTPLAKSPIYHCIRAALKLGLITQNKSKKYLVNWNKPEVRKLIKLRQYLAPLNKEEELIFQKLIIDNPDCREAFFWIFMGKKEFSWKNFVEHGKVVYIFPTVIEMKGGKQKRKVRTKKYINMETGDQIVLETPIERMAVEWGLQLWGRECSLIEEVYIDETRHILYPLDRTLSLEFDYFLKKFLQLYRPFPNSDWSFFPIDLTIFELAPLLRVSVKEIQNRFFLELWQRFPEYIKFSSSSKGALTFRSLSEKTDEKVLKNFIKLNNIWMTHIIVHKKLWEMKQWRD